MRNHVLLSLLFSLSLTAPLASQAQTSPRFSADAITLFEQVTQGYDLNGTRHSAPFNSQILARLTRSSDPHVRDVAQLIPELELLSRMEHQQAGKLQGTFDSQAKEMPANIAAQVIKILASPPSERNDITNAAGVIEAIIGTKPQEQVNEAWAISVLGTGLSLALQNEIREIAIKGHRSVPDGRDALDVTLETTPNPHGIITVTNRTSRTLHHCVLLTRLEANRAAIQAMAAQEDAVGQFILPGFGFSKQTVDGSRLAARLRYLFYAQDKGVMVYLPELPPGGSVTTTLASPSYYSIAKGADISLWSDELAVEHLPAHNWNDAKLAASGRLNINRNSFNGRANSSQPNGGGLQGGSSNNSAAAGGSRANSGGFGGGSQPNGRPFGRGGGTQTNGSSDSQGGTQGGSQTNGNGASPSNGGVFGRGGGSTSAGGIFGRGGGQTNSGGRSPANGTGSTAAPHRVSNPATYNIFIGDMAEDILAANGKSYVEEYFKGQPKLNAKYFPARSQSAICAYIQKLPSGSKVNLIGHSYGGETAATIALHFEESCGLEATMNVLVTVDAVSPVRPKFAEIKRHVVLWLNVQADPDTINDADQLVWTKGHWGTEIQPYTTIFLKAQHLHHLDFDSMMKYKGADGTQESAIEVLLSR